MFQWVYSVLGVWHKGDRSNERNMTMRIKDILHFYLMEDFNLSMATEKEIERAQRYSDSHNLRYDIWQRWLDYREELHCMVTECQ